MNKRILSVLLVIAISAQLSFPLLFIIKNVSVENGKNELYFKVPLKELHYENNIYNCRIYGKADDEKYSDYSGRYIIVTTGNDGFAKLKSSEFPPKGSNFIINEYGTYYLDYLFDYRIATKKYNKISAVRYYALDNNYFSVNNDGSVIADSLNLYMEIKVYKGEAEICGCYVDGKNFEDIIKYYDDNFDELVDIY